MLTKGFFVILDIVVQNNQIECGLAWCVLLSITIRVITVVIIYNILTTVMTRIVVDKSTHPAKPHSIC